MIWHIYRRDTGEYAGSGITEINDDTYEARTDPPPTTDDRIANIEAEVRGMKDRAAVEAAKATPTAKAVAQAVAQDIG